MPLSFLSNENNTEAFNRTKVNTTKLTTSTIIDDDAILWNDVKSFFNVQNSLIIICIVFFFLLLCLVLIIMRLVKTKRSYKKQIKSPIKTYADNQFPFQTNKSSSPIQMGLTSNQIASRGNVISLNEDSRRTSSNSIKPLPTNDEEIETVNEVLGMEERNGKMYYKVNFTGHSADYTAWVCEEDLIPE
ncbi:unnamed protein product [Rotaria socialis]|uniref:Chromo domain-containing protein n=1 Tax=Rotaria socialis TaxID=392032 RepID=A0A818Q2C4_9BILA|nr:unnamed protein product [Rotaria socialis]CAF4493514.1 unnamed protein product [Rotaria socialis]